MTNEATETRKAYRFQVGHRQGTCSLSQSQVAAEIGLPDPPYRRLKLGAGGWPQKNLSGLPNFILLIWTGLQGVENKK